MEKPLIFDKKPVMMKLGVGDYYWCACGKSSNQPFCDGSHRGSGITPVAFKIDAEREVWLCNCKQSGNKPFCDGTHRSL